MKSTKAKDIKREWHLIDVKDKTLGRISSEIANVLMGKSKSNFVRNLDCGDYVVVLNAKEVKVTGNKENNKLYYRHSGYPGGFRKTTLKVMRAEKPEEIIRHAVKGMLPQNRLRDGMLKRLHVSADGEHRFAEKFTKGEIK